MPRPRAIDEAKRRTIFLDYRRYGKKYPVANLHGVARTTVLSIVKEFERWGFALEPRLSLPPALLIKMQAKHLAEVTAALTQLANAVWLPQLVRLAPDFRPPSEQEPSEVDAATLLSPALEWHLKGTAAEGLFADLLRAGTEEAMSRQAFRQTVATRLEETSGFPLLPTHEPSDTGYLEEFVTLLCREYAGERTVLRNHPPASWTSNGNRVLAGGGETVALGDPAQHGALQNGAARFLAEHAPAFEREAEQLLRRYSDLRYAQSVVQQAFADVTAEDLATNICPDCPYPEGDEPPRKQRKPKGATKE